MLHNRPTRYRELIQQREALAREMYLGAKFPRQRAELRVQQYAIERQLQQLREAAR